MIVEIHDGFFDCEENEKPDKALFVTHLLEYHHYISPRPGVTEKIHNLIEYYGTKMSNSLLAASGELLSPSNRICQHLTTIRLSEYDEPQLKVLLFKPSELLVENAPYEWNVYKQIVKAYKADKTYQNIFQLIKMKMKDFSLVPSNAGGYSTIPAMIELKDNGEYCHLYNKKVCVILDRDTDSGTLYDANKNRLFELFSNKRHNEMTDGDVYKLDFGEGFIWHMWYKRSVENYFPESQYEALGVNVDKLNDNHGGYDYYKFDEQDKEVKYEKNMMQRIGRGMSMAAYEKGLKHFAMGNADYSELQLLLLKIAKII